MTEWIYVLARYVFVPASALATGMIIISYGISKALSLFDIKKS